MNLNNFLILIVLYVFFLFSGIDHRALYFLYAIFGILALMKRDFSIGNKDKKLLIFLSFFLAIHIIQIAFYFEGWYSLQGFLRYVSYFLLLFFINRMHTSTLQLFVKMCGYSILVTLPFGLYIAFVVGGRYQFIFGHSNHLAYVCILLAFYFLKLYNGNKVFGYLCAFLLGLIILTTKSTGGLLTYSLLIIYLALSWSGRTIIKKMIIVLPIFGLIAILFSFSERFLDQLKFLEFYDLTLIMERAQLHEAGGIGSGLWRIIHWLSILYEFSFEPWFKILFGLGADTMSQGHYHYSFMITDPHNDFVRVIAEFGFMGFIVFVIYYLRLIKSLPSRGFFVIVTALPMFFGNIIVNFPYVLIASTLIVLLIKSKDEETCVSYAT